jgi:hypothetical protein
MQDISWHKRISACSSLKRAWRTKAAFALTSELGGELLVSVIICYHSCADVGQVITDTPTSRFELLQVELQVEIERWQD